MSKKDGRSRAALLEVITNLQWIKIAWISQHQSFGVNGPVPHPFLNASPALSSEL
jgi:hypothetical protein